MILLLDKNTTQNSTEKLFEDSKILDVRQYIKCVLGTTKPLILWSWHNYDSRRKKYIRIPQMQITITQKLYFFLAATMYNTIFSFSI